ncbi:Heavy-metal-associated domain protein [compost metagenome]|jgi:copper chaperone
MMGMFKLGVMAGRILHPPTLILRKTTMSIEFQVPDMTCGHCVKSITSAVTQAVPGATVAADVASHRVTVTGTDQADKVEAAIREAGYEPARV